MAPPISWTEEHIQAGLARFFQENGRYPTALEFDRCSYLPTARQMQRRFPGGLPAFRAKYLPAEIQDFTKGEIRSGVAKKTIQRSYLYEEEFYGFLTKIFPESLVHEQKRLRPGNVSCDFYIYLSAKAGIAIDLFYAADIYNLARVVNIKLKRYSQLPPSQKVYFISIMNGEITQNLIDATMRNRKGALPPNIVVSTDTDFKRELEGLLAEPELRLFLSQYR